MSVSEVAVRLSARQNFFMTKTFTRPGVQAAIDLSRDTTNNARWQHVFDRYEEMLRTKGGNELVDLNTKCNHILWMDKKPFLTREELMALVEWKFRKGKPRYALRKLLLGNSESFVLDCTRSGLKAADRGDILEAVDELCQLRGVGPATASAILSFRRPDLCPFMDDEVIEALYNGKRGYTTCIFFEITNECKQIASKLDGWTPCKVGMALWTAARLKACSIDVLDMDNPCTKRHGETLSSAQRGMKRRRRQR